MSTAGAFERSCAAGGVVSAGRGVGVAGVVVVGDELVVDVEFGDDVVVDAAQFSDADVDGFAGAFEAHDFVAELVGEPAQHFGFGERSGGVVAAAVFAPSRGEAEGFAAEQGGGRGAGLPAQGLVQAQQGSHGGGALVVPAADFGEGVAAGAAATGDFFFGQVQLRDSCVDEVDEALDSVSWDRHRTHPTARNAQYPHPLYVSGLCVTSRDWPVA